MRSPALACALPVLLLLAGCSGAAGGPAGPSGVPVVLEGSSAVRGVVMSEELFPVVGGLVQVVGGPAADTDEGGAFEIAGIAAGPITLNVTADGYQPKEQKVDVPADGAIEVKIVLAPIPGKAPYKLTFPKTGILWCYLTAVYTAGPWPGNVGLPCPFGTSSSRIIVNVSEGWKAGVYEMAWKTSEDMTLTSSGNGNCFAGSANRPADPCWASTGGRSPLRIQVRPGDLEFAKTRSIDGKQAYPVEAHASYLTGGYRGYFRSEINSTANPVCQEINAANNIPRERGCPLGIGYAMGIRFDIYHTTFYYGIPVNLEKFSAMPDA